MPFPAVIKTIFMHNSSKTVWNLKIKSWDKQEIFGSTSCIDSISLTLCKVISVAFFKKNSEETTKHWCSLHRNPCQAEQFAAPSLQLWCLGTREQEAASELTPRHGAAPGLAIPRRPKDTRGSTCLLGPSVCNAWNAAALPKEPCFKHWEGEKTTGPSASSARTDAWTVEGCLGRQKGALGDQKQKVIPWIKENLFIFTGTTGWFFMQKYLLLSFMSWQSQRGSPSHMVITLPCSGSGIFIPHDDSLNSQ